MASLYSAVKQANLRGQRSLITPWMQEHTDVARDIHKLRSEGYSISTIHRVLKDQFAFPLSDKTLSTWLRNEVTHG